jgi:hypothetical protein
MEAPPLSKLNPKMSDKEMQEAINRHHPSNRFECGAWMHAYQQKHKAIMEGKAPQRFAIMRSLNEWENGLADRLASSLGILLFAILTDRAFQYDFEGEPHLWEGLKSDFIDWRYTAWDKGNSSITLDYVAEHNSEPEFYSFFLEKNLTDIGKDQHSVIWFTDHCPVYKSFENPYLTSNLKALGFQQETAFACLFDFLYRPTQEVIDVLKPQLQLLLQPSVTKVMRAFITSYAAESNLHHLKYFMQCKKYLLLALHDSTHLPRYGVSTLHTSHFTRRLACMQIGIQIRVGDWQLISGSRYIIHPQNHPGLFHHYFDCASQLERMVTPNGQAVIW